MKKGFKDVGECKEGEREKMRNGQKRSGSLNDALPAGPTVLTGHIVQD